MIKRVYKARVARKNKKVRPRRKWTDNIREPTTRKGIRWVENKQQTRNPKQWRKLYKKDET